MNYRHAYHAGNFADVIKHTVVARAVAHLREKPAPFRLIDTHAGAGLTDLTGPQANRTGEWRNGIGRIMGISWPPDIRALLAPYLDGVGAFNPDQQLRIYPGSPALIRGWLRQQDRLIACELEPETAAKLTAAMRPDKRVKVVMIDGWTALAAYLPPKERRGAVLIDPPFEQPDEFQHLLDGLANAYRKWATGIYLLWYPIKSRREVERFAGQVLQLGIPKILRIEVMIAGTEQNRLNGTGLLIVNPPWRLEQELTVLLPALASALADGLPCPTTIDWLANEK